MEIKGVRKTFGGLVALDGVDLELEEGRIYILIGPNGSGKTTLVNVVTGVYKPDSGRVAFNGRDITGLPPHEIYRLGLVRTFQIPQPFLKLSVLENLLVSKRGQSGEALLKAPLRNSWLMEEIEAVEEAFRILEELKLADLWDQPSYALSGGQMKLLEIGRALMSGARMIMMDEPIAGVNPVLAHEVFGRLQRLRDSMGITFFLIEHRLEIALRYVDHVFAMASGKIIAEGKPEKVLMEPKVIEAYLGA